jgi:hypothetical protein
MAATLALVAVLLFALAATPQQKGAVTSPTISVAREGAYTGSPNSPDTTAKTV